jgi:protein-disulfide isomerase
MSLPVRILTRSTTKIRLWAWRLAPPIAALLLLLATFTHPAAADALAPRPGDRGLGAGEAPIVMVAYYSLDCPHCANFHLEVFPPLKEQYIETGKVRIVFRDFPLSWAALQAAILTHCAPPERYFAVQDALLKSIGQWSKAESTLKAVARIGETQGIPEAVYQACFDARVWERQVFEGQKFARDVLGVNSTPTFFINGEKLVGNISFVKLSRGLGDMLDEIARRGTDMTSLGVSE